MPRLTLIALLWAIASAAGVARGDPLDRVTGMESWTQAPPEDTEAEWRDWYRGRIEWRRAAREARLQRAISQELARLLEAGEPSAGAVRQILRNAAAGGSAAPLVATEPERPEVEAAPDAGAAEPSAVSGRAKLKGRRIKARAGQNIGPVSAEKASENPSTGARGAASADSTPDPPAWTQVPVERLDRRGQALDEEGDRELQRVSNKKKRR